MEIEYGKAPMHYIDGVPAYKAGEWPGLKSCKFRSYKRVIRPKEQGIFFNENEAPIVPKKKLLGPGPSKEQVYKTSVKRVQRVSHNQERVEGLRHVPQPERPNIFPGGKKIFFEYKVEKEKQMKLERNMSAADAVRKEFRLMSSIGFGKKELDNLPNDKILNIRFKRDPFGTIRMDEDNDYKGPKTRSQLRQEKRALKTAKARQIQRDSEYVSNLSNFDKKFFPSINKKN